MLQLEDPEHCASGKVMGTCMRMHMHVRVRCACASVRVHARAGPMLTAHEHVQLVGPYIQAGIRTCATTAAPSRTLKLMPTHGALKRAFMCTLTQTCTRACTHAVDQRVHSAGAQTLRNQFHISPLLETMSSESCAPKSNLFSISCSRRAILL